MPLNGTQIVTHAARELGLLDPTATASGELLTDGLAVGTGLLGMWRRKKLLVSGVTRSGPYSLSSGTQSYTIGSGGAFNQTYPTSIDAWSVIPDDDAADPVEVPRGRPLTWDQWQRIRVKSTDGSHPTEMHYDRLYAAGLGNCLFWPIPDNNDVDVVLYQRLAAITSLVAATSYDLQPGMEYALWLHLALALKDRYGAAAVVSPSLEKRAVDAMAAIMVGNILPRQAKTRSAFVIGSARGRRTFNVRTDE